MIEKRFTDVNLDFENNWIKLKDDGLFFIVPIDFSDKEEYGLPTLEDLLNKLDYKMKLYGKQVERLKAKNKRLHRDFDKLWEICKDNGLTEDEIIKEMQR